MDLTVNDKGALGLAKAVADLIRQRLYVFLPFDASSPVDIVAANGDMSLRRLQVKYRRIEKGKIRVPLASIVNGKRVPIALNKIDGWAVYCPDTDRMYYVAVKELRASKHWVVISPDETFDQIRGRQSASIFWES